MVLIQNPNLTRFISEADEKMLTEAAFQKNITEFRAKLQDLSEEEYYDVGVTNILFEALETDNVDVVQTILDHRQRPAHKNRGLIRLAADGLSKKCISFLIDRGVDINEPENNTSPPGWVWGLRNLDMTTWLLDQGADVNTGTHIDMTPMSFAVECCPVDVVRELFRRGNVDITKGELLHSALSRHGGYILYPGVTPMPRRPEELVPAKDIIEVLKIILEQEGIDRIINAKQYANHDQSYGMFFFMNLGPPLRLAAELGLADAVRLLLEHGADPTIRDNKDRTPEFYAEHEGYTEVAELLRAASSRPAK